MYVGQTTTDLQTRMNKHIGASRQGSNLKFHRALREYGVDNFIFEVVCEAATKQELHELETYYINKWNTIEDGYNSVDFGKHNIMFNEQVKHKHDAIMRTEEVRNKISITMKRHRKEHPFTQDTKDKISKALKGNTHFKGHHLSEHHQQLLKQSHYKQVYCINERDEIVAKFSSVKEAANWWYRNGYSDVKVPQYLCDVIKRSNVKNVYIRGLKWIYAKGGDIIEKVD